MPSEGNPLLSENERQILGYKLSCQGFGSRTFSGLSLNEMPGVALPEDALSASHAARV